MFVCLLRLVAVIPIDLSRVIRNPSAQVNLAPRADFIDSVPVRLSVCKLFAARVSPGQK